MTQLITVAPSGRILTITLNRPEALNAMSLAVWAELESALALAADEPGIRAVLLTGRGKAFSAGGDIKEMSPNRTPNEQKERLRLINRVINRLYNFPTPTIAAVNGIAAGNGCSLVMACDLAIAVESAVFVFSFLRLGLVPDGGATWLLPRLIGERRAKELILSARRLPALEALRWGLVNDVVGEEELMEQARALAESLADSPAQTIAFDKQLLSAAAERTLAEALEAESDAQAQCVAHPDYREGVSAFLERRQPQFE